MHLILLHDCEAWTARVADEGMLDSIQHILYLIRRDCVLTTELQRCLSLSSTPAQLVQRRPH